MCGNNIPTAVVIMVHFVEELFRLVARSRCRRFDTILISLPIPVVQNSEVRHPEFGCRNDFLPHKLVRDMHEPSGCKYTFDGERNMFRVRIQVWFSSFLSFLLETGAVFR